MFKSSSTYLIGRSHVKNNLPCQDYTMSWVSEDASFAINVLCDGAGSCSHSDIGAKAVAEYFINYVKDREPKDFSKINEAYALLRDLQILLLKTAAECECTYSDLSSTFLAVIANQKEDCIEFTSFHIGDGLIAVANKDEVKMLSDSENGQFANVTVFTTSKDAFSSLRIQKGTLSLDSSFFLMSDGSSDCLYGKKNNVFSKNISTLHSLMKDGSLSQEKFEKFLSTIVEKTKTGDDCSLSILTNIVDSDEEIPLDLKIEEDKSPEIKLAQSKVEKKDLSELKLALEDANYDIESLKANIIKLKKIAFNKQNNFNILLASIPLIVTLAIIIVLLPILFLS